MDKSIDQRINLLILQNKTYIALKNYMHQMEDNDLFLNNLSNLLKQKYEKNVELINALTTRRDLENVHNKINNCDNTELLSELLYAIKYY